MRKIKYFVAASLDNFIARRDGGVEWLFMDQDYGMTKFFRSVDAVAIGRKTYEKMVGLSSGTASFPRMRNYVFSRTLPAGLRNGVEFVPGDIAAWAERMKALDGKDIWLMGGGELVRDFLANRLVDEIGLAVHPRLLGEGIPLFAPPYPETELELVGCEKYASGLVQLFYKVKPEAPLRNPPAL